MFRNDTVAVVLSIIVILCVVAGVCTVIQINERHEQSEESEEKERLEMTRKQHAEYAAQNLVGIYIRYKTGHYNDDAWFDDGSVATITARVKRDVYEQFAKELSDKQGARFMMLNDGNTIYKVDRETFLSISVTEYKGE